MKDVRDADRCEMYSALKIIGVADENRPCRRG
jgi:hypothetical protein